MLRSTDAPVPVRLLPAGKPPAYVLQNGDTVEFKFFYVPDLNELVVIRPDGKISLQLIGEIQASGRTPSELEAEVVDRYTGVIQEPEVTVLVRQFTEPLIFVGGQVRRPGSIVLKRPTSVLQAILTSGDFIEGAERRNVVVLRHDNNSEKPQFISLNLRDYVAGSSSKSSPCKGDDCEQIVGRQVVGDIYLQANDVVFVPEAQISQVADFFDLYLSKIVPIYRNMGLSFNIEVNDKDNINLGN
ncbi:MAG: polysaccharide biosynthesis/export family protein [Gammaproteobacteria bacterium]